MAEPFGRISPLVWRDVAFTRLEASAQRLFLFFATTQPVRRVGGVPTDPVGWASYTGDATAVDMVIALDALQAAGFVEYDANRVRILRTDLVKVPRAVDAKAVIPTWLRAAVMERDGSRCQACGATDDLTMDHVHPESLGGPTTFDNLRVLCRSCNSRKGARTE